MQNQVKQIIKQIDPEHIQEDRIFFAKKFDERIGFFKELTDASKALKDIRTAELRRLKTELPDKTVEELKEMIMGEEYTPVNSDCTTNKSKFKTPFMRFKQACEKCDEVEAQDTDG